MWREVFVFLFLLAVSSAAIAQDAVHHCVSASGSPVFTDQPCSSLQSTPATTAGAASTSPSPLPSTCPQSAQVLKQRVGDAFEKRDANALAALMQWRGFDQHEGVTDVRRLMTLVRHPLVSIEISNAPSADHWPWEGAPLSGAGRGAEQTLAIQTGMSETGVGARTVFDILDDSGCMWLAPRGTSEQVHTGGTMSRWLPGPDDS